MLVKALVRLRRRASSRFRCDAVRHGLTAETVIGALEDAEDYKAFEAAIIADYDAQAHPVPGGPNKMGNEGASSSAVVCTDGKNAERDRPVTNRCPNEKTKPISAVGV